MGHLSACVDPYRRMDDIPHSSFPSCYADNHRRHHHSCYWLTDTQPDQNGTCEHGDYTDNLVKQTIPSGKCDKNKKYLGILQQQTILRLQLENISSPAC